jgi:hypothetical protein
MNNYKILGTEQGITITRPFSSEMYAHNDKVREIQNDTVIAALEALRDSEDSGLVEDAVKACSGYGYGSGYSQDDMIDDAIKNVESSSNNWMREEIWPDFIKLGLVQPIEIDYVGYKKL